MYQKLIQSENWDDIANLIIQLTDENKRLKAEKQRLTNELMNFKMKHRQEERRKEYQHIVLISEMRQIRYE